jgi:hypothetical protein
VCRPGRPLHDDVIPLFQVSDEVIRDKLRHEVVPMTEAASPISLKGKA